MTTVVVTRTPREVLRSWRFWIVVGVIALVAGVIGAMTSSALASGTPLSPSNPAPTGAKALAEVLRSQGVEVLEPEGLDAALDAADGSTLLVYDPSGFLGASALERIGDSGAARVVLLDPADSALAVLAPAVRIVGSSDTAATADCAVPEVERAGEVAGESRLYSVGSGATVCWADEDGSARAVYLDDERTIVLGTIGAIANEQIVLGGNAAFSLGVLGAHERLVWFLPTVADAAGGAAPDIGSLSPDWVVPLALLAIIVAIVSGFWRGRRFGPLVVEPLPAVVRADETMRGRARLAARAGARQRTADALRLGALDRIASTCGLPVSADVERIATAAAERTARAPGAVLDLLRDRVLGDDRALVQLANELAELESAVRAVR